MLQSCIIFPPRSRGVKRHSKLTPDDTENALSLNGDVRTTMLGADYRRGPLTVGLSVGRTMGLGGYSGPSAGQMTTSMTGFYPLGGLPHQRPRVRLGSHRLRHRRAEPDAGQRHGP